MKYDHETWQWDRSDRDSEREQVTAAQPYNRESDLERTALFASAAFVSECDDLDCEDGLDEAKWDAAMVEACGAEVGS